MKKENNRKAEPLPNRAAAKILYNFFFVFEAE